MNPAPKSSLQVRSFLDALDALGLDTRNLLAALGFERASLLASTPQLTAAVDRALWETAAACSREPALSLRIATQLRAAALASLEAPPAACSSFAQMFDRAQKCVRAVDSRAELEMSHEGSLVTLRMRDELLPAPETVECAFALMHAFAGQLHVSGGLLREVHFSHAAGSDPTRYSQYFGCPVQFGAEHNELVMDTQLLKLDAAPQPEPVAAAPVTPSKSHLDPLLNSVRTRLLRQLQDGAPDVLGLARELHMSQRTLRRKLHALGTRYQDLLDELRAQLAVDYVLRAQQDLAGVARRLGFSDPSAFYRAFKRWTGTTPSDFRRRTRERLTAARPPA